jgi:hypothetical protein
MLPSAGKRGGPTQLGPLEKASLSHWTILVRFRVTLRLTVSQPFYLGVEPLLGLMSRF